MTLTHTNSAPVRSSSRAGFREQHSHHSGGGRTIGPIGRLGHWTATHFRAVAAARATLEAHGVQFQGDIVDTGVCHMGFFADPGGDALMLHHRYAPRVPEA